MAKGKYEILFIFLVAMLLLVTWLKNSMLIERIHDLEDSNMALRMELQHVLIGSEMNKSVVPVLEIKRGSQDDENQEWGFRTFCDDYQ